MEYHETPPPGSHLADVPLQPRMLSASTRYNPGPAHIDAAQSLILSKSTADHFVGTKRTPPSPSVRSEPPSFPLHLERRALRLNKTTAFENAMSMTSVTLIHLARSFF
jgi:hypothetical protein